MFLSFVVAQRFSGLMAYLQNSHGTGDDGMVPDSARAHIREESTESGTATVAGQHSPLLLT